MSTILHIPNPDRELTDVEIRGWPIVISRGLALGAMAIAPHHSMNISRKYEVHISHYNYNQLTLDLTAWPMLEDEIQQLSAALLYGRRKD